MRSRIVGMHYIGSHAAEIMSPYGSLLSKGFTFGELMEQIGVHVSSGEGFSYIKTSSSEEVDPNEVSC